MPLKGVPSKYKSHVLASNGESGYLADHTRRHNMSADQRSLGNHACLPSDHPLHYPGVKPMDALRDENAGGRKAGRSNYAEGGSGGRKSLGIQEGARAGLVSNNLPQSNHSVSRRNGSNRAS